MAATMDESRVALTRPVERDMDPIIETYPERRTMVARPATHSPEAEFELVTHVRGLFARARQHRRPLVAQWTRAYNVLHNRTWGARHPYMPNPELPEIYPIMRAWCGWMTDQAPTFVVKPAVAPGAPEYQWSALIADDLQQTLQGVWTIHNYDMAVNRVLWDAATYGTGIFKAKWDASLVGGLGDAKLLRVDPYSFYVDPAATSMEDSNYFIECRRMSVQELDRMIPGASKLVGHSDMDEGDESPNRLRGVAQGQIPRANPGAIAPNTSNAYGLPGQTDRAAVSDADGVTVFECWLRQHKHVDRDAAVEGSDAMRPPHELRGGKTTIDTWRCVIVAANRVLFDKPAIEINSSGRHPYERYVLQDEGEFWGQSLVDLLASSQISINRLLAAMEHNIWLAGNPVFVESVRAGTDKVRMTNRPGQRIRVNESVDGIRWLEPPQIHPQMTTLINFYKSEMENISGLTAINRGFMPEGRNSEGTLNTVQEAGFVTIRQALRELRSTLRRAGELIASMVVEFYDTPRFVAWVGRSGEESSVSLRSMHFYLPGPDGQTPLRFQLLVDADSFVSDEERRNTALTLLGLGGLDAEAVLEVFRWPGRTRTIARMRELAAAQLLEGPTKRQAARA